MSVIINAISLAFTILYWFLIAHIILSWLPKDGIFATLNEIVDTIALPIIAPFRKVVPVIDLGGVGLDLSTIAALIVLSLLRGAIVGILIRL